LVGIKYFEAIGKLIHMREAYKKTEVVASSYLHRKGDLYTIVTNPAN
jgi:hypothetical protein